MKIMPVQPAFQSTQGELSEASSDKAVVAALNKIQKMQVASTSANQRKAGPGIDFHEHID
ncbi:MAG: hypothetical protein VZR00_05865 [Lachnospiraceae bacterium]|jgi:hypothetical protein|nr:hypothetical protein [Lachnospiraceae bacterium]MEE3461404.1 hypothetical protein [Lachnospiraceae bacterium]